MAKPPPPAPRIDPSQIPRLLVPPSGSAFPTWSSRSLIGDDVAENKIGERGMLLHLNCVLTIVSQICSSFFKFGFFVSHALYPFL